MQKYKLYDFENDQKWQKYAQGIDKSISKERLEYIKELWYQRNVNQKQEQKEKEKQIEIEKIQKESKLGYYFYTMQNIFTFAFMIFLFPQFGILSNFISLIRSIQEQKQYILKNGINNEFLQNVFYIWIYQPFPGMINVLTMSPLLIHGWIELSEFLYLHYPKVYENIKKWIDLTRQNKNKILYQKNQLEIIMLFILIIGRILQYGSTILIILHILFLQLKYIFNQISKDVWKQIDQNYQDNQLFQYLKPLVIHLFNN